MTDKPQYGEFAYPGKADFSKVIMSPEVKVMPEEEAKDKLADILHGIIRDLRSSKRYEKYDFHNRETNPPSIGFGIVGRPEERLELSSDINRTTHDRMKFRYLLERVSVNAGGEVESSEELFSVTRVTTMRDGNTPQLQTTEAPGGDAAAILAEFQEVYSANKEQLAAVFGGA